MNPPVLARDRQFARLLCGIAADGGSGIVTATRGKLRRLFCLEQGWLVYATSNLIEEQFAEFLVRTGALTPSQRLEAVEVAASAKRKLTAVLVAQGVPSVDRLRRASEGLVRELLTSTLEWPDGRFQHESGTPKLDDEMVVRLSPRALILQHALKHPASLDAVRVRIGPPDMRPTAGKDEALEGLERDALDDYLLTRCTGQVDLGTIVAESPADEAATLRRLYGFLLVGLLDPQDREARRAAGRAREAELNREECLGRLTLSSGHDHYAVLGLDKTSRRDQVRDAYYALARRYHPDRFRSGPLTDLLPRFEEFFARVTAAYNTLYDPASRAEYDQQLAAPAAAEMQATDTGYIARQNYLRGKAAAAHKRYGEAVTFLENAIQQDPSQAEYHLELGLVQARNPRFRAEAEERLLQAVNLSPTLVDGYVALGQMYLRAGRPGRAARMAREALRWEPGHVEASELLARAGSAADEVEGGALRAIFGGS